MDLEEASVKSDKQDWESNFKAMFTRTKTIYSPSSSLTLFQEYFPLNDSKNNFKGAYRHPLCVDAALVKSTKVS